MMFKISLRRANQPWHWPQFSRLARPIALHRCFRRGNGGGGGGWDMAAGRWTWAAAGRGGGGGHGGRRSTGWWRISTAGGGGVGSRWRIFVAAGGAGWWTHRRWTHSVGRTCRAWTLRAPTGRTSVVGTPLWPHLVAPGQFRTSTRRRWTWTRAHTFAAGQSRKTAHTSRYWTPPAIFWHGPLVGIITGPLGPWLGMVGDYYGEYVWALAIKALQSPPTAPHERQGNPFGPYHHHPSQSPYGGVGDT